MRILNLMPAVWNVLLASNLIWSYIFKKSIKFQYLICYFRTTFNAVLGLNDLHIIEFCFLHFAQRSNFFGNGVVIVLLTVSVFNHSD